MSEQGRSASVGVWATLLLSTAVAGLIAVSPPVRAGCAASPAPCIDILSPNGGEALTGGVAQTLAFSLDRVVDNAAVDWLALEYRGNATAPWTTLFNLTAPTLAELFDSATFTLPADDTTSAELRLSVSVPGEGTDSDRTDAAFTVDSTAPRLTWERPLVPSVAVFCPPCDPLFGPNLTFGSRAWDVTLFLSEPLNQSSLEENTSLAVDLVDTGNMTITAGFVIPSGNLTFAWAANGSAVRVSHPDPVGANTGTALFLLKVIDPVDESAPGNRGLPDLECPNDASVILYACLLGLTATYFSEPLNLPPVVSVASPAGGEVWSGGATVPVDFTISDDRRDPWQDQPTQVTVNYSSPAGNGTIFSGLLANGAHTVNWTVPSVSSLSYQVTAVDAGGLVTGAPLSGTASTPPFEVDATPPFVLSTAPADGATGIDPAAPITITFSEGMNSATLASCVRLLPNPGGLSVTLSPDGLTATIAHPVLDLEQEYTVVVCAGASDASVPGLPLGGHAFAFTTLVPPNVAPVVDLNLDAPAVPSPGAMLTLRWAASDPEDARLQTGAELLPGSTVITQGLYANGMQSLSWTLQAADGAVAVRICVTDSRGATACDVESLVADGTRPTVAVSPADGATGVDPRTPFRLTFSEPMAAADLALAVFLLPGVPGMVAAWLDASTVEVDHDGLTPGVAYTLRLGCSLQDTATPGNFLAGCPVVTTFTVTPPDLPPEVAFLEPVAGTLVDPVTVQFRWTAADDRDASLAYTVAWRNATATGAVDAGTMAGEASALWSVPATLIGDVTLEVCVQDSAGQSACDTLSFTIERTPPPPTPVEQGELLVTDSGLTVTFPSTVPASNVSAILIGGVGTPEYTWTYENGQTTLEISTEDLEACADHTLTLLDSLGLLAWQRTFRTPCGPAVTVDVPAEGMLRGGAIVLVAWNVSHEQATPLRLYLNYSAIGGLDGFPALVFTETMAPGENALSWKVPSIDTLQLVLRLTAVDAAGRPGWNVTRMLQVDSTPPVPFIYRDGDLVTGTPVRFDGSASFDSVSAIARYRWRLWTPSRGILAQSVAAAFAHTFALEGEHLVTLEVWDAAGNVAAVTQRLLVGAPGGAGEITVTTIAGGSLAGLAALGGTTLAASERARYWTFRTFFLPLYTRLHPEELKDQVTRGRIWGYIQGNPGDSFYNIKGVLEVSTGTLMHHLQILERERIVRSQLRGSRRFYYAAGAKMPDNGDGLHQVQHRIVEVAKEQATGISMADLAFVLGISPQLLNYHVGVLEGKGLVERERVGVRKLVFPRTARAGPRDLRA